MNNNGEKAYRFILFMVIALSPTLTLANYVTNSFGMYTTADTIVIFGVVLTVVLLFTLKYIKRLFGYLPYMIGALSVLVFSMIMHSNLYYLNKVSIDVVYNSVYFLAGVELALNERTLKTINTASKFTIISSFALLILNALQNNIISDHDMVTAYTVLIPSVLLLAEHYRTHCMADLVCSFLGLFAIILYGTRGPLLAYCVSLCVLICFFGRSNKKLLFCFALILAVLFKKEILLLLRNLLQLFNLGSLRIIDMLIAGEISDENGRAVIQMTVLDQLKASPLLGLGIYGDRTTLNLYPHNLFLEILVQFGVPLGLFVLVSFSLFVVGRYKQLNRDGKILTATILSALFGKLMVSGSYLNEYLLYFVIGFLINHGKGIFYRNSQAD